MLKLGQMKQEGSESASKRKRKTVHPKTSKEKIYLFCPSDNRNFPHPILPYRKFPYKIKKDLTFPFVEALYSRCQTKGAEKNEDTAGRRAGRDQQKEYPVL